MLSNKLDMCMQNHETSTGRETIFCETSEKEKRRASPRLEIPRSDDLPIFHMEPIREKTCFGKNHRFCSQLLCTHKTPVHGQDSCACTRFLCTHRVLVHAQESCACTRFAC